MKERPNLFQPPKFEKPISISLTTDITSNMSIMSDVNRGKIIEEVPVDQPQSQEIKLDIDALNVEAKSHLKMDPPIESNKEDSLTKSCENKQNFIKKLLP